MEVDITKKHRNISRNTNLWHVRIQWGKKKYEERFRDLEYSGVVEALVAAIKWRDATKKRIGMPITDKLCIGFPNSNTNVVGVYDDSRRLRYMAMWRDQQGKKKGWSVSYKNIPRDQAFEKARRIREKNEGLRVAGRC